MKIFKQVCKVLFWILIAALLIAPLGLLYEISNQELEEYQRPTLPALKQMAMGRVVQVTRQDVKEYVTVFGKFTSDESVYQEITVKTPNAIRWDVAAGDEIQEGQVLGTYYGDPVTAQYTGIIQSINSYSSDNSYIKIRLLENLVLECDVQQETLSVLKRGRNMMTEDGYPVELVYASNVCSSAGTYRVKLVVDADIYAYGQAAELIVFSGLQYPQVLVVDRDCVYQKEAGENSSWYVRTVTAAGEVLREVEVEIGFAIGNMICVTGVPEGTYCDAGYSAVAGGAAG